MGHPWVVSVGTERADYVVKASPLDCDSLGGEHGLDLSEPDFRICRPKWWQLNTNCY